MSAVADEMAIPSDPDILLWYGTAVCLVAAIMFGVLWLDGFLSVRPPSQPGARERSVSGPLRWWRAMAWLIDPLSVHLAPLLTARWRFGAADRLRRAGFEMVLGADQFAAGKLVSGLIAAGLASLSSMALGYGSTVAILVASAIGFWLPDAWLRDCAAARRNRVLRELPFYLDVITLSIESGLNLSSALAQAADKGPMGPLRDEFERVLRDLRAGRTRALALRALAERLAIPAIGSLVAALIVAEQQGSALAPLLRAQSEQRRNERFQRAEKLAMEAPVKMLLPLLVFIFPCTFVILLFPIVGRLLMEGWLR